MPLALACKWIFSALRGPESEISKRATFISDVIGRYSPWSRAKSSTVWPWSEVTSGLMLRVRVLIAIVAGALVVPTAALAQRPASRSERATIVAAAVHQGEVSSTQGACLSVRMSTVSQGYAVLAWPSRLSRACAAVAATGTIVEQQSGTGWVVVAAGSSFACPLNTVPAAVASDLGICGSAPAVTSPGHTTKSGRSSHPGAGRSFRPRRGTHSS